MSNQTKIIIPPELEEIRAKLAAQIEPGGGFKTGKEADAVYDEALKDLQKINEEKREAPKYLFTRVPVSSGSAMGGNVQREIDEANLESGLRLNGDRHAQNYENHREDQISRRYE